MRLSKVAGGVTEPQSKQARFGHRLKGRSGLSISVREGTPVHSRSFHLLPNHGLLYTSVGKGKYGRIVF